MSPYYFLLLAFVQAATEFLPISSSGHLLFLKGLFGIEDIPILFDIMIHVGSLCAILIFYRRQLITILANAWREIREKRDDKPDLKMIFYISISTVVTLIFYVFFKDSIEARYQSPAVLPVTYTVTTVILFSTAWMTGAKTTSVLAKKIYLPIVVGLFQGLAIMPGISRSGATISPLLLMGIKREQATFYSFFLAIPAILGALVFKLSDLENLAYLSEHKGVIAASFVVSMLFSYLFLFLLTWVIRKGRFWIFSFYTLCMIILSVVLF